MNTKEHWEKVYENKSPAEVSWTQERPEVSLQLIEDAKLPKNATIIDVGGGDSKLVDFLLQDGYENITVLDISAKALEKAKKRLGKDADRVTWIVSDIADFQPMETYDLWHDRATFHFLTTKEQIEHYQSITSNFVSKNLIIGTFSNDGPLKCSGLEIVQYDEHSLSKIFENSFDLIRCLTSDHITPFETVQNFQFCSFKKK